MVKICFLPLTLAYLRKTAHLRTSRPRTVQLKTVQPKTARLKIAKLQTAQLQNSATQNSTKLLFLCEHIILIEITSNEIGI